MILTLILAGLCVVGVIATARGVRDRPWPIPTLRDYDTRRPRP